MSDLRRRSLLTGVAGGTLAAMAAAAVVGLYLLRPPPQRVACPANMPKKN